MGPSSIQAPAAELDVLACPGAREGLVFQVTTVKNSLHRTGRIPVRNQRRRQDHRRALRPARSTARAGEKVGFKGRSRLPSGTSEQRNARRSKVPLGKWDLLPDPTSLAARQRPPRLRGTNRSRPPRPLGAGPRATGPATRARANASASRRAARRNGPAVGGKVVRRPA